MKGLISVIIPAYRCASTVAAAIDSALAQQEPVEILVIDDQSDDDLADVLAPYLERQEVRYFRNETRLGAAGSRNRGVSLAKGSYIAFLDADDWWESTKLSKQMELLKSTGAVLCSTGRELVTPDGKKTGRVIGVHPEITYRRLLLHNCINCSSVVMRTEVAREFPMEHEDSHEDYITWLKILKKYRRAVAVDEPLLDYRLSATGKSGNKLHSAAMTYRVYRYLGFGRIKASLCFIAYAVNGVRKYLFSYI
jgi:teichuronic acid biosynthesis glycosyltransferase TuaG